MAKKQTRIIPSGRTLSTNDKFLGNSKTGSAKTRPIVAIEVNKNGDIAAAPGSSHPGKNRTEIKRLSRGERKTFIKHYLEIEDNEGKPIRVNEKFKENHPNMDLNKREVELVRNKIFKNSKQVDRNNKLITRFRNRK